MPKLYVRHSEARNLEVVELACDQEVPDDGFCYILGSEGLLKRISNPIYEGSVPAGTCPLLAPQKWGVTSKLPRIGQASIEAIVGFFHQVWREYRSEAIVQLYYSPRERKYLVLVPDQEVDVWQKVDGRWHYADLTYETPNTPAELLRRGYRLVGSIHSHGAYAAGHSSVDTADEADRNGLHITVGEVNRKVPQFSCSFMLHGQRQLLVTEDVIQGFSRRRDPPDHWIDRVTKEESPWTQRWTEWSDSWSSPSTGWSTSYDDDSYDDPRDAPATEPGDGSWEPAVRRDGWEEESGC